MSVLLVVGAEMYATWPRRVLPPGESRWVCQRDRQTDGRTDTIPLYYAFH